MREAPTIAEAGYPLTENGIWKRLEVIGPDGIEAHMDECRVLYTMLTFMREYGIGSGKLAGLRPDDFRVLGPILDTFRELRKEGNGVEKLSRASKRLLADILGL